MKGIGKSLSRTPFLLSSKVGMAKKSSDPEFDDYERHFSSLEKAADKLIKDTKAFQEAVSVLFTAGAAFGDRFATIMQPIAGEYDLIGKHPDAEHTIRSVIPYQTAMEEIKSLIGPELDLIKTRILSPAIEFQSVMKTIRKTITKREHKLTDFDRHNNSLTKLRDKKEKSLSDEKNLFKLEQDFEIATNEYDYINNALKQDLPRFMMMSTQFIDPLFNSFFYMQLNIYYLILEKMNSFADAAKYDISNIPGSQIAANYENNRTDAWQEIENMNIVKRIISVSKMVQASRAQGTATIGRSGSTATSSSVSDHKTPGGKTTSPVVAPPPPYSASNGAGTKRAPPPPPPMKSKPKPQVQYVVALYDFVAQAEGDLSFNAGDRIELVERTQSSEDWWTGRVNGHQGVFPGNYVQET